MLSPELKTHGTSDHDYEHDERSCKARDYVYVGIPDYHHQSKDLRVAQIIFAKKEFDPSPTVSTARPKPQDSDQLLPFLGMVYPKVSVQLVLVYKEPHQGYDAGYKQ